MMLFRVFLGIGFSASLVFVSGCLTEDASNAGEACQYHSDCDGLCLEGVCVDVAEADVEAEMNESDERSAEGIDGRRGASERRNDGSEEATTVNRGDAQSTDEAENGRTGTGGFETDESGSGRSQDVEEEAGTSEADTSNTALKGSNESCTANVECLSGICAVVQGGDRCAPASTACVPACPSGQACVDVGGGMGLCLATNDGRPMQGDDGSDVGTVGSGGATGSTDEDSSDQSSNNDGPSNVESAAQACSDFFQCLSNCRSSDVGCQQACRQASTSAGLARAEAIQSCIQNQGCIGLDNRVDSQCIEESCLSEYEACFGPMPTPNGTGTCEDLITCTNTCLDNDADCRFACVESSSEEGYADFQSLLRCVDTNNCNREAGTDLTCIETNCAMEAVPCLATEPGADVTNPPPDFQGVCPNDVSFSGQLTGERSEVPNGGTPVFEPWSANYQSGIGEVLAAMPAEAILDDETTDDVDEGRQGLVLDNPIQITEATVIATNYKGSQGISRSRTSFWIGDADGALQVYLNYMEPIGVPDFEIQTGQKISFTARRINRYFDKPQIIGIGILNADTGKEESDMTIVSTNNPVYVWKPDRALTAGDVNRVVSITNNLTGTGNECGGNYRCWDIDYGFGRAIFRTSSEYLVSGDCVTYVGPLNFFQGEPQLNVDNVDWLRSY